MRFPWVSFFLGASLLGCHDPRPSLTSVSPDKAYSEDDVRLALLGGDFLPATVLDPGSGRRIAVTDGFSARVGKDGHWADLTDLNWLSTTQLQATLPQAAAQNLPPSPLDVELTDPRGQKAVLANAFNELGDDLSQPTVTITSPSKTAPPPYAPGLTIDGSFHAAAQPPGTLDQLRWNYVEEGVQKPDTQCSVVEGAQEADCAFQILIAGGPHKSNQIVVVASATEKARNPRPGSDSIILALLPAPTIELITPASGGIGGGTNVLIKGSGFLPTTKAYLDGALLFPDGGVRVDDETLTGYTPPHAAGWTVLTVETPIGPTGLLSTPGDATAAGAFQYLPPPTIITIAPTSGTSAGGTDVSIYGESFDTSTRIYFGASLESAVPLQQPLLQLNTLITGRTPPGLGMTTVWAYNPDLGVTPSPIGFTWTVP